MPSGYESPRVPLLRFTSPEEGYCIERDTEVAPASVHGEGATWLPKFDYHLDESDPDVAVLRRHERERASWRPQKRTTRSWSRRSRTAWTPRKTKSKLGSELLKTPLERSSQNSSSTRFGE